jgi:hypothetical protein
MNKENLPPKILDFKRKIYDSPFCNLCINIILDNYNHGNNICNTTLLFHNFLQNTIFEIIFEYSKTNIPKIPI